MKKSRGSKKALKAAVTLMALVAALATTGCTGSTLMGPDTSATSGQQANQAGHTMKPGAETSLSGNSMRP